MEQARKARKAALPIVEGPYLKAMCTIFAQMCDDLWLGHPGIILDSPSMTALLDSITCNIMLNNAITNTFKHGCTEYQEL